MRRSDRAIEPPGAPIEIADDDHVSACPTTAIRAGMERAAGRVGERDVPSLVAAREENRRDDEAPHSAGAGAAARKARIHLLAASMKMKTSADIARAHSVDKRYP